MLRDMQTRKHQQHCEPRKWNHDGAECNSEDRAERAANAENMAAREKNREADPREQQR